MKKGVNTKKETWLRQGINRHTNCCDIILTEEADRIIINSPVFPASVEQDLNYNLVSANHQKILKRPRAKKAKKSPEINNNEWKEKCESYETEVKELKSEVESMKKEVAIVNELKIELETMKKEVAIVKESTKNEVSELKSEIVMLKSHRDLYKKLVENKMGNN